MGEFSKPGGQDRIAGIRVESCNSYFNPMPANPSASQAMENPPPTTTIDNRNRLALLLPVNHEPDSRWGWRYAIRARDDGLDVTVCLLHVTKRIGYCQVVGDGGPSPAALNRSYPPMPYLDEAIETFAQAAIPLRAVLASGGPVEGILAMAQRLECDQIVLPLNDRPGLLAGFWHHNTVRFVQERERQVPVVTVDENGQPIVGIYARR